MLTNFLTQIGVMLIPLSVVILIFANDDFGGWRFWGMVFVGVVFMVFGFLSVRMAVKAAKIEEAERISRNALTVALMASMAQKMGVDVDSIFKQRAELDKELMAQGGKPKRGRRSSASAHPDNL